MSQADDLDQGAAPIMILDRLRDSMRNTKHLSQILQGARIKRHYFDPANEEDQMVYLVFLRTGKWIKQYYFEPPFTNVVSMVERKLIEHALKSVEAKAQPVIDGINASRIAQAA